jgi:hypothetical protein
MNTPRLSALLAAAILTLAPGCATITGTATGWATGLVDAPAQNYRINRDAFDEHPEYWAPNVLIVAPVGLVLGSLLGLVKGVAMDVRWLLGQTEYGEVFAGYGRPSIWRPYTLHQTVEE